MIKAKPKGIRATKAAATRIVLIAAARKLFAEQGFHSTGTHQIVMDAGVSRGALQHHFARKEDLFRAVHEAVEQDIMEAEVRTWVSNVPGARWEGLKDSIDAFLDAATTPEVQRIILIDGPAVLGWADWRRLQEHYGLGLIEQAVRDGLEVGQIRAQKSGPLAGLILSMIGEAALMVAHASQPDEARSEAKIAMETMLASMQ
ncbi:TetR/AcrR family transcriptional regulator [Rhizorhapis sp. SPR117]|uniref:TetR/AcrR family transcriptional regulator n=1 Tax=Rhizorhapis sp. SPR117 TaxID=2912611 RepID=UPI001F3A42C1|nr:TetR/AcrR family transcriptional regulator [Rhizorhapis sp. SPR117]